MNADQPVPRGVECADRPQNADRILSSPCRVCGHATCGLGWLPCDLCRVTIRLDAIEERLGL